MDTPEENVEPLPAKAADNAEELKIQCEHADAEIELSRRSLKSPTDSDDNLLGHPIWAPGYPGSGSEMLRQIISEITGGLAAEDVYQHKFSCARPRQTVTCKTHYPFFNFKVPPRIEETRRINPKAQDFHSNTFLLLRNPLQALPSLCNTLHEWRESAQTHTTKAPLEMWRNWRDGNFPKRWNQWMQLIRYWQNNNESGGSKYNVTVYLPYEEMTSPQTGPALMEAMADELRTAGFAVQDNKHLPCQWHKVVQVKATKKRQQDKVFVPGFTRAQKETMVEGLREMVEEFAVTAPRLAAILKGYEQKVAQNTPLDDGDNDPDAAVSTD